MVYRTEEEKFRNAAKEIKELHEKGQPVLVGTISVEKSEHLSGILKKMGVQHEVLNAKNHEREASSWRRRGAKARSPSPPTWPAAVPTFCWAATPSS